MIGGFRRVLTQMVVCGPYYHKSRSLLNLKRFIIIIYFFAHQNGAASVRIQKKIVIFRHNIIFTSLGVSIQFGFLLCKFCVVY